MLGMLLLPVAQSSGGSSGSAVGFLLPLLLMGGVFYFLLIRPQQRRQRSQRDLLSSLSVGDDVVTIGGLLGVIREMDDDEVTLEVAPDVEVRVIRSGIARKITYEDDTYEEVPEHEEEVPEHEEEEAGGQP